ncbi:MAG: hypothetical protein IT495_03475 [Gammaproteobacteria bacterium]|nr:hypothetical protein [Gammaproteobacteria bacterium]
MDRQIATVGLGRMGANMARRHARGGMRVLGFDTSPAAGAAVTGEPDLTTVDTLGAVAGALRPPRVIRLMLPAGSATDETLTALAPLLDLAAVSETWRHGTVVRSWLLDLCAGLLAEDQDLAAVAPVVADSGEGRWTVAEAIELSVAAPVIGMALNQRFASRGNGDYGARVLAMLRHRFGDHAMSPD